VQHGSYRPTIGQPALAGLRPFSTMPSEKRPPRPIEQEGELLLQRAPTLGLVAEPRTEDRSRGTDEESLIRLLLEREIVTPMADDAVCRRHENQPSIHAVRQPSEGPLAPETSENRPEQENGDDVRRQAMGVRVCRNERKECTGRHPGPPQARRPQRWQTVDPPPVRTARACALPRVPAAAAGHDNDLALMRRIDEMFTAWPFLGSRRMTAMLRVDGYAINRKRVRRLMADGPLPSLAAP
jgi:HTH-like domain